MKIGVVIFVRINTKLRLLLACGGSWAMAVRLVSLFVSTLLQSRYDQEKS